MTEDSQKPLVKEFWEDKIRNFVDLPAFLAKRRLLLEDLSNTFDIQVMKSSALAFAMQALVLQYFISGFLGVVIVLTPKVILEKQFSLAPAPENSSMIVRLLPAGVLPTGGILGDTPKLLEEVENSYSDFDEFWQGLALITAAETFRRWCLRQRRPLKRLDVADRTFVYYSVAILFFPAALSACIDEVQSAISERGFDVPYEGYFVLVRGLIFMWCLMQLYRQAYKLRVLDDRDAGEPRRNFGWIAVAATVIGTLVGGFLVTVSLILWAKVKLSI